VIAQTLQRGERRPPVLRRGARLGAIGSRGGGHALLYRQQWSAPLPSLQQVLPGPPAAHFPASWKAAGPQTGRGWAMHGRPAAGPSRARTPQGEASPPGSAPP